MKDFYYYLVPWLQKKTAGIILHFGINDTPYKNEDEIYVDKLEVVEEKSVILHDNILTSHLNKDGLHLNSHDAIRLAENFISKIRMD